MGVRKPFLTRLFPSIKGRSEQGFELLRADEQIGDAGYVPSPPALRRDLPLVQRACDGTDRDRAFCAQNAQNWQHAPGILICGADQSRSTDRTRFPDVRGIPQLRAARLPDCEGHLRAFGDQPPLLLGERRIEVQHERVGVAPQFGDDERHPLRHQAGDERHVAREAVELGDQDGAFGLARGGQRRGELGAAIKRVGALAGLDFGELRNDGEVLGFGEPLDGGALRLDPEARALLLPCGDTIVGNSAFHTKGIPPFALCMNPLSEQ